MLKLGYNKPMSNEAYHGDDEYKSSSQLKTMLEDPETYYKKYITKVIPSEQKDCFIVGTAFHEKLLEPKEYEKNYTTLPSDIKQKRGKKYDEFLEKNPNKIILGNKQLIEVDIMYDGTMENKDAIEILAKGKKEVTFTAIIDGIKVKCRFDQLTLKPFGKGPSIAADPKSIDKMLIGQRAKRICQNRIAGLSYDLSAALYLDIVNQFISEWNEKNPNKKYALVEKFYWIFSSKVFKGCKVYEASPAMIENGRTKYKEALALIKYHTENDWQFEEGIELLDPAEYDIIGSKNEGEEVASWST